MTLEVINISKYYGKHLALKNFSMTLNPGEIVGLIGKNGSGKTTLLNCIVNNIHISSGEIFFRGKKLLENKHLIAKFGVLIESCFLDYLNAYENLKLLMLADGINDKEDIHNQLNMVLDLVGLEERKKEFVKNYSFGMKQRLGLAQSLLNNKEVLILDEPLVGLDAMGRELVKKILFEKAKSGGNAVIFSDHNLNEVKDICDRIILIDNGIKKFDGLFDDKKKYIVDLERLNEGLKNLILEKFNDVKIEENTLIFSNPDIINNLLKFLITQNIEITNLNVREGSLLSLFKGEIDNVEHEVDMEYRV
ncbi:ABC transporter ATP-binding protein [Neobacillus notoginsengisoli]|uniref:ABC transporter ATP-binding protein n=2 Tax=Neobacillus notoginsengisoli TaxID=1578198 RepID=A0A417YZJ9_9BACI|nr:ABC transporter ATP-binding protein [Neobacillus notoginsengisoli]